MLVRLVAIILSFDPVEMDPGSNFYETNAFLT